MSGGNRTIVLGAAVAAILAGAWLMWRSRTPAPHVDTPPAQDQVSPVKPRQAVDQPPSTGQSSVLGPLTGPATSASAHADELRQHLETALSSLPQTPPAPDALAQSIHDALHAYVSDSLSAFETYCSLHGIGSFESTASDPAYVPTMWSQFHAWFKTAVVNHDELTIRWRVQRGVEQAVDDVQSIRTTSRDAARPFWTQAAPRDRNSIEVIFPMVAKDLDGVIFESRLGLEFGWSPEARTWVLLRSRHYDVPASTRLVEAPV